MFPLSGKREDNQIKLTGKLSIQMNLGPYLEILGFF